MLGESSAIEEDDPGPSVLPLPRRRHSPTWADRRGIRAEDRAWHSPWLRLHDHLALRYGIRADRPRRWERPDPSDLLNMPALLRQASAMVDADITRTVRGVTNGLLEGLPGGLTPDHLDILRRVRDKPSAGVNLAEYLHTSPQRVSRLTAGLETSGLVVRDPGWQDLRTRRTEITDAGRDLLLEVEDLLRGLTDLWLEALDAQETEALLLVLAALDDEP